MNFELTILGCSSALPTAARFPTAQLLDVNGAYYLIDCGEGAQIQLRKYRFKIQRINAIFISHFHGDHYLGLPGLLNSMQLLGREKPVKVYGPPELEQVISLQVGPEHLSYPLEFIPHKDIKTPVLLHEDEHITATGFPLQHRIPCVGVLVREQPRPRKLIRWKVEEEKPPIVAMQQMKQGNDYTDEAGVDYKYLDWTEEPPPPRSFAFCSDTLYDPSLVPVVQDVDLLYHESTFLHDRKELARKKYHSTAHEAAHIARAAQVGQLVLGHYSARYDDIQPFLNEARDVFPNTELGEQGRLYSVKLKP